MYAIEDKNKCHFCSRNSRKVTMICYNIYSERLREVLKLNLMTNTHKWGPRPKWLELVFLVWQFPINSDEHLVSILVTEATLMSELNNLRKEGLCMQHTFSKWSQVISKIQPLEIHYVNLCPDTLRISHTPSVSSKLLDHTTSVFHELKYSQNALADREKCKSQGITTESFFGLHTEKPRAQVSPHGLRHQAQGHLSSLSRCHTVNRTVAVWGHQSKAVRGMLCKLSKFWTTPFHNHSSESQSPVTATL